MIKKLHGKMLLPAFFAASMLTSHAQTALDFDGTDDYVQTSFAGVLGSADRTFEAWAYIPSSASGTGAKAILDYGTNNTYSRNTFQVNTTNGRVAFVSGGANLSSPDNSILFDTWNHVAFVLNNGTGYLYVNGMEVTSGILSAVNTPSGYENVKIGERVSGGNALFNGSIDEVRIWDVARTEAEILADMDTELCAGTSGLVAYYKFNDGVADADNTGLVTATDMVSGNDGTLTNFGLSAGTTSNWTSGTSLTAVSTIDTTVSNDGSVLTANHADAVYQWVDVDNAYAAIDGATSQTFSPSEGGNYAVEITFDGCTDMSETINFVVVEPVIYTKTGLNFDGVDDYVQSPSIPVSGNNPCTVEAWVRTTKNSLPTGEGGDGQSVICDWGNNSPGQRFTLNLLWSNSVRLEVGQGGVSGTTPVNDGEWHHVAAVYDPTLATKVTLYVDGVQDATGNFNTTTLYIPQYGTGVRLGKRVANDNLFEGDMDEVRVWNYALTETELQSRMNRELCGDETGLVAYFPLGEGVAGTDNAGMITTNDMSPSGNDGVLNNFTLSGDTSNWGGGRDLVSLTDATLTANHAGAVYQWVDCDNDSAAIDGATSQTFMPEASGNYAVEITVDGCVTTSECMAVEVEALGVEETFKNNMKVYPNPTSGNLNVTLNGVYDTVEAQLVSITGKVVGQYQFSNTNGFAIELNNVNSGLYFLNLKADNLDAVTIKVVKM